MSEELILAKLIEEPLKVGQRIVVIKDDQNPLKGTVGYFGTTLFNPGDWIGVILDENKGENNGTVMGKTYFSCKEGHGMFVRQNTCLLLDEGVVDIVPPSPDAVGPSIPESHAVADDKSNTPSITPTEMEELEIWNPESGVWETFTYQRSAPRSETKIEPRRRSTSPSPPDGPDFDHPYGYYPPRISFPCDECSCITRTKETLERHKLYYHDVKK